MEDRRFGDVNNSQIVFEFSESPGPKAISWGQWEECVCGVDLDVTLNFPFVLYNLEQVTESL